MKKKLSIHSENILPIIKKWLYSEKDIFLRELVSNACDAMHKLKVIDPSKKDFCIDIRIDKEKKTLSISDTGIGMNEQEIEEYISQIAFSGAEDFLQKYKDQSDGIIGHFGLGFYSSYMVANHVTIDTQSYDTEKNPVFWSCDGSSDYEISQGSRKETGTTITLHISEENSEYLQEEKIEEILKKFCPYLPFPIYLKDKKINHKDPLFLKPASECTEQEYLDFYNELYPFDEPPAFWIHLNIDYPFHLKGILYFPKIGKNFDFSKNFIKLFCNRVFVSDNCKDLLPDYLSILKGAIDSTDIPLNVSRSYLQTDRTVKQIASHIAKKIADRLSNLYLHENEKFLSIWKEIEILIKYGMLQDEKFYEKAKSFLVFKSGDKYKTLEELKSLKTVYYSSSEDSPLIEIYKNKNKEVIISDTFIDPALLSHLEAKEEIEFKRLDGDINDLVEEKEELLEPDGQSKASKITSFVKTFLTNVEVDAKNFAENLPAMILMPEKERRMRDYFALSQKDFALPTKKTFILNANNPLIQNTYKISLSNPDLAQKIFEQIYDLTQLSQKELSFQDLNSFISRSNTILEKLTGFSS